MAKYQLPPLKDEKLFEELTCDVFNFVENTTSYVNTDFQIFGVKGQNQKGIDILSNEPPVNASKKLNASPVLLLNHCLKKSLSTPGTGIWQPIRMIKIIHIRYNSLRLISFTLKTFLRVSNIRSPLLYHLQLRFLLLRFH